MGRPRPRSVGSVSVIRFRISDFGGFGSSGILISRGGIPRPSGNFPELFSQILEGININREIGCRVSHECLYFGFLAASGMGAKPDQTTSLQEAPGDAAQGGGLPAHAEQGDICTTTTTNNNNHDNDNNTYVSLSLYI